MKRALVLGGGGARGAYQFGVWRCLREKRQRFNLIVGTSCGALNGGLIVQGKYKEARELWENISVNKVLNNGVNLDFDLDLLMSQKEKFLPMLKTAVKKKGLDTAPIFAIIQQLADAKRIKRSKMDFFVLTVEVPNLMPYQIDVKSLANEKIADYLMASASCFPAFPIKNIDGKKYVDGGYFDNLPINTAIEQKADEIIAVNLKGPGIIRKPRSNNAKITIIESYWSLGSVLDFRCELAERNIAIGYFDAKKTFGDYLGYAYTFKKKTKQLDNLMVLMNEQIKLINDDKSNKLLGALSWRLNDEDDALLHKNKSVITNNDRLLRLLERLMEMLEYSPEQLYDIKKVTLEIKETIADVEKMNIKGWLKRFMKNPKITIKQMEKKNLVFSLAGELEDIDDNVIKMFYRVFPSECLLGLLINCLTRL